MDNKSKNANLPGICSIKQLSNLFQDEPLIRERARPLMIQIQIKYQREKCSTPFESEIGLFAGYFGAALLSVVLSLFLIVRGVDIF